MPTLEIIASHIIRQQELVIGPLAWSEAQKVPGLIVEPDHSGVLLRDRDPKAIIDGLVNQYERLFGRASHEVCKEAAASLITKLPSSEVPASLLA